MNKTATGSLASRAQSHAQAQTTDPVCGMKVDPAIARHSHVHESVTYYFCCDGCRTKFVEAPAKYLAGAAARDAGVAQPAPQAAPLPHSGHAGRGGHDMRAAEAAKHRAAPEAAASYTCPMDSEVRAEVPGPCPKCGMALEAPRATPSRGAIEYVCPMHPEVVQDHPGSCPKCGMALELRAAAAEEASNPELADMTRRFWMSTALAVLLLLISMSDMLPGQPLMRALGDGPFVWIQL
ncbi:MAG: heavy metal-binding domain-containing protein, partial [Candidatus Binataceae bacterium]